MSSAQEHVAFPLGAAVNVASEQRGDAIQTHIVGASSYFESGKPFKSLLYKPFRGTAIGICYRSRIDQKLDGSFTGFPLPAARSSASATVRLPDRLNVSLRQTILRQFDLLASVEWINWSRVDRLQLAGPALANPAFPLRTIPLEYCDG